VNKRKEEEKKIVEIILYGKDLFLFTPASVFMFHAVKCAGVQARKKL
jgi:hypothetical protein